MSIKSHVTLIFLILLALLGSSVFTMILMTNSSERVAQVERYRFEASELANQLRQSSDDLTRMVRTYAATGDSSYKKYFDEIVAIRDGKAPRPENYNHAYWDLVTANGERPSPFGPPAALIDLMKATGLGPKEVAKLEEAKKNSDDLIRLETQAFNAMEGLFADENGAPAIKRAPDPAYALALLHGEAYHNAKNEIMRPIGEFREMIDRRTFENVERALVRESKYRKLVMFQVAATILFSLTAIISIRRRIIIPLTKLSRVAKQVEAGNLEARAEVSSIDEIGILDNAFNKMMDQTQSGIKKLECEIDERKRAEKALREIKNDLENRVNERTADIKAQKNALVQSEKQFRNLIEGSIQGVFIHKDWKFLFTNQALADIFGYASVDEINSLGKFKSLVAPEERKRMWGNYLARMRGEYVPDIYEYRGIRKDDSLIWLELRVKVVDWLGQKAMQCVVIDITERKKAQEVLQQQNERFTAALENMSQGLAMYDSEQRVIVSNERYALMYGLSPEQVKPGTLFQQILEHRIASGTYAGDTPEEFVQEACAAVAKTNASKKNLKLIDGRFIVISYQPMLDGGWLDTHEDITDYREIEERLSHMAHHDALTDLPNRVLLRDRIDQELKRVRRGGGFVLLYLDLDGFKEINDTLGHTTGDQLLKVVGERLRSCVRETDLVARLGGDEFAIVQTSSGQPEDADALAERICKVISAPYELGQNEIVVEMSIGITIAPKDGRDYEQLLKNADLALYRAKKDSRGTYCFFEPDMEAGVKDRHALALDLRKALGDDQFELYYQPLINLQDSKTSGFEALIRWHHPERGMISPTEFIPIAEEIGLINQIGEWVIHQACTEAVNWPDDINVAVNVSPVQFRRGGILQIVKNALATSRLPASNLEIEITESVWLQDKHATLAILHQLRDLGVKISMDDFGTGYSSLSYLQSFPFDKIKIDSSFVKDLTRGNDGIGIVQAVVGFASRLGATTVAEGVENEEQLNIVRKEGCTQAQGYFFSRPLPAKELSFLFPRQLTNRQFTKRIESTA